MTYETIVSLLTRIDSEGRCAGWRQSRERKKSFTGMVPAILTGLMPLVPDTGAGQLSAWCTRRGDGTLLKSGTVRRQTTAELP